MIGTRTVVPRRSGTRSSRMNVETPALGGELHLDVEPVALLRPREQAGRAHPSSFRRRGRDQVADDDEQQHEP